ncbi:MAG: S-layer homology domain-containing protein, partial [Tissierellia bacterium]|nr:S-layer homology domain-containing protein [Tissierellia bacterium]
FRPNDNISYRELEIIMRRFIDKEFKWHHTAAKMLYEKKTRTSFYDSIDNKINRGEVSYMLYILNDWRY